MTEIWTFKTARYTVECIEKEAEFVDPLVQDSSIVEGVNNGLVTVNRATARVLWGEVEVGSASLQDNIYVFETTRIDPSTGLTHDDDPQDHGRYMQTDRSYRYKVVRRAIKDARTSLKELGLL